MEKQGYRPREGYELHLLYQSVKMRLITKRYRPREGYELHRQK